VISNLTKGFLYIPDSPGFYFVTTTIAV